MATLLSSCALFSGKEFDIRYGDRQTLVFTGKGAAAGIMLDAVMGGVGVAIGVAIDEGIAKEISKSIIEVNPGYDFTQIVKHELQTARKITYTEKHLLTQVVINRYGFRTISGNHAASFNDGASPWISLEFVCEGVSKTINYPDNVETPIVAELQEVKSNGQFSTKQL